MQAPAEQKPTLDLRLASPGAKPDAEAAERIREMTRATFQAEREFETAANDLKEPEAFLRNMLDGKVHSHTNTYDLPAEDVFEMFKSSRDPKSVHGFSDYQSAFDAFKAVKVRLVSAAGARRTQRTALMELLNVEGPKLATALREKHDDFLAEATAGFLPWCADEAEAKELAGQTDAASAWSQLSFQWMLNGPGSNSGTAVTSATVFLSLWEKLCGGGAADS